MIKIIILKILKINILKYLIIKNFILVYNNITKIHKIDIDIKIHLS